MSASFESAFVAAVARVECTHTPMASALMPVAFAYLMTMFRYTEPGSRCLSSLPVRLFVTGRKRGPSRSNSTPPPAAFRRLHVLLNESQHHRVNGDVPDFVALTVDTKMHDALAAVNVTKAQQTQLLAPDAVIEQGGEDCAIPYTLQRVRGWGLQQPSGLRVAEGRGAALVIIGGGPRLTPSIGLPRTTFCSQR